jgi:pimeloyl-ACP methyl ester carboxylesterase
LTHRGSIVRLGDGRELAWCEWGVPTGPAVLAFHGTPASRVWWPGEALTTAAGVRLITVDRPGYGRSDPLPGRRVIDWAEDVAELTELCGIDRFGVVGWSGGAPYAAAVAAALPSRLTGVCIACSASITCALPGVELDDDDRRVIDLLERFGPAEAASRYAEEQRAWADRVRKDPATLFGVSDAAEGDRWVLEDAAVANGLYSCFREAMRQGAIGVAGDLVALFTPWGFSLEQIEPHVDLWHGAQDDFVTVEAIERVAALVPRAALTTWPDVGHFGVARYWGSVLAAALGGLPRADEGSSRRRSAS